MDWFLYDRDLHHEKVKHEIQLNLFYVAGLFLYLLKNFKNQRFSNVFMRYRKKPLAQNGLKP